MEFPKIIKNNEDYIILATLLLAILQVIGFLPDSVDYFGLGTNVKFGYIALFALAMFIFWKDYSMRGRAAKLKNTMQQQPQQYQYPPQYQRQQYPQQQQQYPQQQYPQQQQQQYQQPQAPQLQPLPPAQSAPSRSDYLRQQQQQPSQQNEDPIPEVAQPKPKVPADVWDTFNKE